MSESNEPIGRAIVTPATPPTQREMDADEWASTAIRERLPAIRGLAEKWMVTTSTITGLLGAGAILGASADVRAMTGCWDLLFGGLAALALLAAAGAIYLAFLASQPSVQDIPPGADERVQLQDTLFKNACDNLQNSRRLIGVAVVFLILAVSVLWYAPQAAKELSGEASVVPALRVATK